MLNKIIKLSLTLIVLPITLFAQSLEDNPYFKRSVELRILSQEALTKSDYEAAYNYAVEGLQALDQFESVNALLLAEQRANTARQRGLNTQNPELFSEIIENIDNARASLREEDFAASRSFSERALAQLDELMQNAQNMAETYTVVRGDSLWKIAGRPSIYGDHFAWPRIYMANRHRLRYPDNPDLIYPDQVFDIPR